MRISDWSSDVCSSDLTGSTPSRRSPARRARRTGEDGGVRSRSRVEQSFGPAAPIAGEQPPFVETVRAILPEFDAERGNAIARPMRDRKSTRLNSSHYSDSRLPSPALMKQKAIKT